MQIYLQLMLAEIYLYIRGIQDEDEDWGRWRDVVFRAKGALTPHGIKFTPVPPQNRRKRGGPAFLKDPVVAEDKSAWTKYKDTALAKVEVETEATRPLQLTTSEALSKIATMHSAVFPSPDALSPVNLITNTSTTTAPTTTTDGMTYCPECYLPLHPDPKPDRLYIFLHALRYTTSLGCFETDMPEWAAEGWEWDQS